MLELYRQCPRKELENLCEDGNLNGSMKTHKVAIGLGSNIKKNQDPCYYLRRTIEQFRADKKIKILKISPLYTSDAMLPEVAPPAWNQSYLNLALTCETFLNPLQLLDYSQSVEKLLGRRSQEHWAPREIDIDLLDIQDFRLQSSRLTLPHRGLLQRPFALLPLSDLEPHWTFPCQQKASDAILKWRAEDMPYRTRRAALSLTQLIGILNLTPDSFSDEGRYQHLDQALAHAEKMLENGASRIDVGAESTRPQATPLSPEEEWNRLEPFLKNFRGCVSLDTRHPEVAERALPWDVQAINDVSGFENPKMREILAKSKVDLIVMHSLGIPPSSRQVVPGKVMACLESWGTEKIQILEKSGIQRERILIDPGIGFGKTPEQNWEILRNAEKLHALGVRVLLGHSRKSFLTCVTDQPPSERDLETNLISGHLATKQIHYLRVHDVASHQRAMKLMNYLL